ncbi:MAG: thiol-disulfide isomerase/thioredoxin [Gammaproteobacteria bacterium]|jgi:thiol-disulfide isomerase/thioredoxin
MSKDGVKKFDKPSFDKNTMKVQRRRVLKSLLGSMGLAALGAAPNLRAQGHDYGIKGQSAPNLKVTNWIDSNGNPGNFELADHAGKWIFLKCFQSWCPGCHSHGFPALKKISDALEDNPQVVFAGIQTVFEGPNTNTVDKVRKMQLQYDLRLPMSHDDGGSRGRSNTMFDYRTGGTPWMVVITPDRYVAYNDFGIDADKAIKFFKEMTS